MNTNAMMKPNAFWGEVDVRALKEDYRAWLKKAAEIRNKLGDRKYLLDRYLVQLLESANTFVSQEVVQDGYDNSDNLNAIVTQVLRKEPEEIPTHVGSMVREYVQGHSLPYREEQTRIHAYTAMFSLRYFEFVAERYIDNQDEGLYLAYDYTQLGSLFDSIAGILGSKGEMEKLNELFFKCFLRTSPMELYRQGHIAGLIDTLLYRDIESDHTVMQLLLKEWEDTDDAAI